MKRFCLVEVWKGVDHKVNTHARVKVQNDVVRPHIHKLVVCLSTNIEQTCLVRLHKLQYYTLA